jgi:hypothetical protein
MPTAADFSQERQELEAVLASGVFNRAPNLAQLLTYVCARYFEGAGEQIKEYNIAVDALGRPPDFDQKRDSIVRVEAHRLRKRLGEYYGAEGADHLVQIEIPPGQYAPRFLVRGDAVPSLSADALVAQAGAGPAPLIGHPLPDSLALRPRTNGSPDRHSPVEAPSKAHLAPRAMLPTARGSRNTLIVTACLLVFGTGAIAWWKAPAKKTSRAGIAPVGNYGPGEEVRILAGHAGADYIDRLGRVWRSDRYFQGGYTYETLDHPIIGTREQRIYQSRREGAFSYEIPVPDRSYEVRLHFAETLYGDNNVAGGGESSRVFNVYLNGKEVLHEFDVIGEAGASTADVRTFKDVSPSSDGKIHLRFEPYTNPPMLSAIEITPGTPGKLRPIRMITLDRAYTDKQGRVWEPERYARGGQLVLRTKAVEGAADPELFHGERFGNLKYVIPVPPGRYGVTFYFAETWFGPGTPAGGGIGSRVFDILCNGVALRRAFDIFKEAGGAERATTLTIHGIESDAQGKLNIALSPTRNYAAINAMEVLDESR